MLANISSRVPSNGGNDLYKPDLDRQLYSYYGNGGGVEPMKPAIIVPYGCTNG